MSENTTVQEEADELPDIHVRAALAAFVKAQSFNRYWCTSFGDRVEVAFGSEKRMAPQSDGAGHIALEYPLAVSIDFETARQLHDTLGMVLRPYLEMLKAAESENA